MKKLIIATLLSVSNLCFAQSNIIATHVTITNLAGRVYRNITLDYASSNSIANYVVYTDANLTWGIIKFTDCQLETWNQFNLPRYAKETVAELIRQRDQEQQAEAYRIAKEREIEADRLAKEQQDSLAQQQFAEWQAKQERDRQAAIFARHHQTVTTITNSTEEQAIDALKSSPTRLSPEEKGYREDILTSLIAISSATSVGIQRDTYGSLLFKARYALESEKTKLPLERNKKYILCAEKAIHYYTKANAVWLDQFRHKAFDTLDNSDAENYEVGTYTLMYQHDFDDLRLNGILVDVPSIRETRNDENTFLVPVKKCINLYWQAADNYIQKMQNDAQQ